jgi:hypothetical protein
MEPYLDTRGDWSYWYFTLQLAVAVFTAIKREKVGTNII